MFYLSLCLIPFEDSSAHLAYHAHKTGCKGATYYCLGCDTVLAQLQNQTVAWVKLIFVHNSSLTDKLTVKL